MVVIMLVGLIALISIASYTGTENNVRVELNTLALAISYMRQTSITSHDKQQIIFDLNNHSYSYCGIKHPLRNNVQFGYISGIKGPPSSPIHELKSAVTFPHKSLVVTHLGVSSSGTIYLTDKAHTCTYALSVPVGCSEVLKKYRWENGWREL